MKYLPYDHASAASILGTLFRWVRHGWAGVSSPRGRRPFLSPAGRRRLTVAALLLGLVIQMVALWFLGQLVDLSISLMELWLELARKHLELTL